MLNSINDYKINSIESYELIRKKKISKLASFIDFWFSGLITLKSSLVLDGEYFLFIYPNNSVLIKKKKSIIVDEVDVTNKIDTTKQFKSLELDGFIYKKYRKI